MNKTELVVVGAGPGGLTAAIEAAREGVSVLVLDENAKPGGRIFGQLNDGFTIRRQRDLGADAKCGQGLLNEFMALSEKIEFIGDAQVFGLFGGQEVAFQRHGEWHAVPFEFMVVATGAYDRSVPFPGWHLPGVMTAGGAQTLIKYQRVLPGQRFLLAGTGPLQLVLANQIIDSGGKIVSICEAGSINGLAAGFRGFSNNPKLLLQGLSYLYRIYRNGVPILRNHVIAEARGRRELETVDVVGVDSNWQPLPNTRKTFKIDVLCIGYGLVPSVEFTNLAGCRHHYDARRGGWVPARTPNMQTSLTNLFAVGDATGIAGSEMAMAEGRIAGMAVAELLGRLNSKDFTARSQPHRRQINRLKKLREFLDEISWLRPGLSNIARDDTLICRCEDLTLGDLKSIIEDGVTDINEIKKLTRLGMGHCQGRTCGPALLEILRHRYSVSPEQMGNLHRRPPLKPLPLGVIAAFANSPIHGK